MSDSRIQFDVTVVDTASDHGDCPWWLVLLLSLLIAAAPWSLFLLLAGVSALTS